MEEFNNALSNNIRFLRKQLGLNQTQLAEELEISRSNVAAYESKGVEPRLKIILKMAKFFDITVQDLINLKLKEDQAYDKFESATSSNTLSVDNPSIQNDEITEFIDKSIKINKVLEGFKSFYTFKKESIVENSPSKDKLMHDIDNFINLMEHLLSYNESVINAINKNKPQRA